jgi:hypothetical protein
MSRFYEHEKKCKILLRVGLEPTIMCVLEIRRTYCATSVDVMRKKITVYDYCFTWQLVTYVRRRTSSAPRPCHDGAGQSIDIDLFEAEIRCEASLGGRRNPAPAIEEQPTT